MFSWLEYEIPGMPKTDYLVLHFGDPGGRPGGAKKT